MYSITMVSFYWISHIGVWVLKSPTPFKGLFAYGSSVKVFDSSSVCNLNSNEVEWVFVHYVLVKMPQKGLFEIYELASSTVAMKGSLIDGVGLVCRGYQRNGNECEVHRLTLKTISGNWSQRGFDQAGNDGYIVAIMRHSEDFQMFQTETGGCLGDFWASPFLVRVAEFGLDFSFKRMIMSCYMLDNGKGCAQLMFDGLSMALVEGEDKYRCCATHFDEVIEKNIVHVDFILLINPIDLSKGFLISLSDATTLLGLQCRDALLKHVDLLFEGVDVKHLSMDSPPLGLEGQEVDSLVVILNESNYHTCREGVNPFLIARSTRDVEAGFIAYKMFDGSLACFEENSLFSVAGCDMSILTSQYGLRSEHYDVLMQELYFATITDEEQVFVLIFLKSGAVKAQPVLPENGGVLLSHNGGALSENAGARSHFMFSTDLVKSLVVGLLLPTANFEGIKSDGYSDMLLAINMDCMLCVCYRNGENGSRQARSYRSCVIDCSDINCSVYAVLSAEFGVRLSDTPFEGKTIVFLHKDHGLQISRVWTVYAAMHIAGCMLHQNCRCANWLEVEIDNAVFGSLVNPATELVRGHRCPTYVLGPVLTRKLRDCSIQLVFVRLFGSHVELCLWMQAIVNMDFLF